MGTIESRVLVIARRFKELGVSAAEPIPAVTTVECMLRPLQAPEMADLFGGPDEPEDEDDGGTRAKTHSYGLGAGLWALSPQRRRS